jgi:CelD/BcsL family acetyltransferase involved in cellulose biosynthesis
MNVELTSDLDRVEEIRDEWTILFNEAGGNSIFSHYDWVYQQIHRKNIGQFLVFLLFDNVHQLAGVFPFIIKYKRIMKKKLRVFSHAGGNIADYSPFILSDRINRNVAMRKISSAIIDAQPDTWDFIDIAGLNDRDDVSRLFAATLVDMIHGKRVFHENTFSIQYDQVYGESKKISDINRRFNKLLNTSDISITIGDEVNGTILEKMVEHHYSRFPGMGFNNVHFQEIIKHLYESEDFRKHIEFSHIQSGNDFIAGHFGFRFDSRIYYYVPVFNDDYKIYGPGQYLLMKMIEYYRDKGYSRFDFLRGGEEYKKNWANTVYGNYSVVGVPANASWLHKAITDVYLLRHELSQCRNTSITKN